MNKTMKTLLKIAAVLALAVAQVQAQFVAPPTVQTPITISSNFFIAGSLTTNLTTAQKNNIAIGKNGVGFAIRVGTTNAASTTNATIVLELLANGTDVVDNQTFTLSVPQSGTTGYNYYTNLLPTTANLANGMYLRVKSIQNTNVMGIFITNITANTLQ
jgi:hypothetical protein